MDLNFNYDSTEIFVYEFPFTNECLDQLLGISFCDFLRIEEVVLDKLDPNGEFHKKSLEDFIDQYLTSEQQQRVHEYIYNKMEAITNRFFKPVNMKSAATYQ